MRIRSAPLALLAAATLASPAAFAQQRKAPAVTQPVPPTGELPSAGVAQVQPASTTPMPVPNDLVQTHPDGLTAEQVGRRAMDTSFSAKQALETMRSAQERVSQQWATFLPRLTGTARYTRLSSFTVPDINFAPPGAPPVIVPGSSIYPLFLDQYLLQANLTVPITDYFLKLNQNLSAASHSADAARFDLGTARATAYTNGKAAYYTWLLARGQVVVAVQSLNDQRTHLNDARNQFAVGNASKADVLRAETNVATAELQVEVTKEAADLAETQMRVALHLPRDARVAPAEGLDVTPPPFSGNLPTMVEEAIGARFEVKSALANAEALRRQAASASGSQLPTVSAFGDAIYANPNPRLFPAQDKFFPTWDLGLQAVWAPNDVLLNGASSRDLNARANAAEAQAQVVREGIEVEVTQAYNNVKQYDVALESTKRQLASAQEAYRVARELFNNGRGTSTTLTDAETELTRARLDALNATVNARVARVRLEHALGRDLRGIAAAP